MRSLYREKKYICNEYLEVDIFPVFEYQKSRGRKRKPTSEVQRRLNRRNSERKLIRLLNTNFTNKDIRFDLTYSPENIPESPERAQREMQNFLRRVKRYCMHNGLPELKYVAVTECGKRSGRIHHHIVMNGGIDVSVLSEIWGRGYTTAKPLRFDDTGIVGIAKYLIKDPVLSKRWCASRNLKQPKESTRDGRVSQKKAKEIYLTEHACRAEIEKLYEGYTLSEINTYENGYNAGYYITLILRKRQQKPRTGRGERSCR